jgi:hypothetical protein
MFSCNSNLLLSESKVQALPEPMAMEEGSYVSWGQNRHFQTYQSSICSFQFSTSVMINFRGQLDWIKVYLEV